MVNYFYDCYSILNKVYSDKAYIKQAINGTIIEEQNRALIVKTCYGVLDKDIELSFYIKKLASKNPKLVIRTILKIAMYTIKYLSKKPYAVTQNAVELTKRLGKGGMSGFVNAFLRKFISSEIDFSEAADEALSIKYSYPLFAVKRLISDYGLARAEKIIATESTDNTLVFYGIDGEKYLTDRKVSFQNTPFNNVFSVANFVRNKDYHDGIYTYQALGSVAICDIIEPCENILDCCAAPGGKSVRLSYKCSHVTSWDIHPHRVGLINDYVRRMKRTNIATDIKDSKEFDERFIDVFDAVLCDAPCSGLGVVSDNPDIKLNRSQESLEDLNTEQFAILNTVSKYVKKGGSLYYSTCSVLQDENIRIVERFLAEHGNFEICKINSPLAHEDYNGTNAFLPDISGGMGFYIAKLKRVK